MKWIIIAVVANLLFLALTSIHFHQKLLTLKKQIMPAKSNKLLRDILNVIFSRERLPDSAMQVINILRKSYPIHHCTIFWTESNRFKVLASNVDSDYHNDLEAAVQDEIDDLAEYNANIRVSEDGLSYPSARERGIKYNYFIPLHSGGELIGAILIENTNTDFTVEKELFSMIIENITIAMQNLINQDKVSQMALQDGLTGVSNRHAMNVELRKMVEDRQRFSLAIFDIDHFKRFNDTYGHLFGDHALKVISSFVKSKLSPTDQLYRFGGEEFVIVMQNRDSRDAHAYIEGIREGIETLNVEDERAKTSVTCSFGVCEFQREQDFSEIIKKADKALYQSKEQGRNRTTSV